MQNFLPIIHIAVGKFRIYCILELASEYFKL